ncbi:MAG: metal-sulfur cluster assembly factor [candidate division Zixibacteria bacterium]|nr:metal-sulfur cluster assembly factor [candidate division Zixibacteria bacterium]MBU1471123.1 metal-sulfur cluster assembly factor [candidate division Zixibacteria bacterium]MBU2625646.1 metal-sulfur cluster assembly factor [candidate division Zixibacteria bacterium]
MLTKNAVYEALQFVTDPEIGLSIIDLGLVYDVSIEDDKNIKVTMTLTTPACPYGPALINEVKDVSGSLDGVEKVEVEVVWEPLWNPQEMASDEAKDVLGIW